MASIPITYINEDGDKIYISKPPKLPPLAKQSDSFRELYDAMTSKLTDEGLLDHARKLYRVMLIANTLPVFLKAASVVSGPLKRPRLTDAGLSNVSHAIAMAMAFDAFNVDGHHLVPNASRLEGLEFASVDGHEYSILKVVLNLQMRIDHFIHNSGNQLRKDFKPGATDADRLRSGVALIFTLDKIVEQSLENTR